MSQPRRTPAGSSSPWAHPGTSRRQAIQIGSVGILGLGINHLVGLRDAMSADGVQPAGKAKSCIFIFLSGGLAQHDSFDMKPEAPENIRGEFRPIATRTPSIHICEHLPQNRQKQNYGSFALISAQGIDRDQRRSVHSNPQKTFALHVNA